MVWFTWGDFSHAQVPNPDYSFFLVAAAVNVPCATRIQIASSGILASNETWCENVIFALVSNKGVRFTGTAFILQ